MFLFRHQMAACSESGAYRGSRRSGGKLAIVVGVCGWLLVLATPSSSEAAINIIDPGGPSPQDIRGVVLAPSPDGGVLAGRDLAGNILNLGTLVSGARFHNLGKFDSWNEFDPSFNVGGGVMNGSVEAILPLEDGRVLVAGNFSQYRGEDVPRIIRLHADGSLDETFDPGEGPDWTVRDLHLLPDGRILMAGRFSEVDGVPRAGVARLHSDGSLDTTFDAGSGPDGSPLGGRTVHAIDTDSSGRILVGGAFASFSESTAWNLVRLHPDGAVDASFDIGNGLWNYTLADIYSDESTVYDLKVLGDDSVLVVGRFANFNETPASRVVKVRPNGSPDPDFSVGQVGGTVLAMDLDEQGRILIGGIFTSIQGEPRARVGRLLANGTIDPTFDPGDALGSPVFDLAVLVDGRIAVTGHFTEVNGLAQPNVAYLTPQGGIAPPRPPDTLVEGRATPNYAVLEWEAVGNTSHYLFQRRIGVEGEWETIGEPTEDEPFLVDFNVGGGTTYFYRVEAVNPGGSSGYSQQWELTPPETPWPGLAAMDPEILEGADGIIRVIEVLPDGKILVAGDFRQFQGEPRHGIARLLPGGELDPDFVPPAADEGDPFSFPSTPPSPLHMHALEALADGRILVGGRFRLDQGQTNLVRLLPDGTLDPEFDVGTALNGRVLAVAVDGEDRILAGGEFHNSNGQRRPPLFRLESDGGLDEEFEWENDKGRVSALLLAPDGSLFVGVESRPGANFLDQDTLTLMWVSGSAVPAAVVHLSPDDVQLRRYIFGEESSPDEINSLVPDGRGGLLVGGHFSDVENSGDGAWLVRVGTDGEVDTSFEVNFATTSDPEPFLGFPGTPPKVRVTVLKVRSDGSILAGGVFDEVNGMPRHHLVLLYPDGSVDPNFDPGAGPQRVSGTDSSGGYFYTEQQPVPILRGLAETVDGSLLVSGEMTHWDGVPIRGMVRLLNAPSGPGTLGIETLSSSSIQLNWTPGSGGVDGYHVERSLDPAGGWIIVETLGSGVGEFTDAGLDPGAEYFYRIRAFSEIGSSGGFHAFGSTTLTLHQEWRMGYGLPIEVPAGSTESAGGVPSLLAYALGLNPRVAGPQDLPGAELAGDRLEMVFEAVRSELEYVVEVSNDLVDWGTEGVEVENTSEGVSASVPIPPDEQIFLRLRVLEP